MANIDCTSEFSLDRTSPDSLRQWLDALPENAMLSFKESRINDMANVKHYQGKIVAMWSEIRGETDNPNA